MTLEIIDGPTIAAGDSLSDVLDCGGDELVRITMPGDWDDAVLSFEISSDGQFFNPLVGPDGVEITVRVIHGTALVVDQRWARALGYLKLRSGIKDRPVAQSSERQFAVAVLRPGAAP